MFEDLDLSFSVAVFVPISKILKLFFREQADNISLDYLHG